MGLPAKNLMARGATGTWDYVTNSVFDVMNSKHRRKFYDTHGIDGKPVGIIARTNHQKSFDDPPRRPLKRS